MKGKGNDGKGNNPKRDDWETPQWLFNLLDKQFDFTFDCCATKDNSKCLSYSDEFDKLEDTGDDLDMCWINPPFSKARKMFEHFFKIVKKGVGIYRCDNMETKIWQEVILKNATWIFIPKGRIAYSYNEKVRQGKGTRFPSALIGFNVEAIKNIEGVTLWQKEFIDGH